ncbi:hypothetical protein TNCV_1819201 [Trichonephila clavipes]|nr:hypothetical protein TNCV_1819201 [Trichonephila clavipes]
MVLSGNFAELNRTVTCMVLKANDRRTSCPCHDEFRGPRSDYVRKVASENNNNNNIKVRRESDSKLNLDSSENIIQDHCCGVRYACALLQVNRRRQ